MTALPLLLITVAAHVTILECDNQMHDVGIWHGHFYGKNHSIQNQDIPETNPLHFIEFYPDTTRWERYRVLDIMEGQRTNNDGLKQLHCEGTPIS